MPNTPSKRPFAAHFRLLRAPQRGSGEIFVEAGRQDDVARRQQFLGTHELLINAAERRAAIARDVAGGVEPGAAVAFMLHERRPDQRLGPRHEYAVDAEVVFVVDGNGVDRH